MATIERFEDLQCWKCGRELRRTVYRYTRFKEFGRDFALVTQIRRAAEGFEREGNKEFVQFLSQAKGSIGEVKDQLYTAVDESYINQSEFDAAYELAEETTRIVGGLMGYLRRSENSGSKFKRGGPTTPNSKLRTPNFAA